MLDWNSIKKKNKSKLPSNYEVDVPTNSGARLNPIKKNPLTEASKTYQQSSLLGGNLGKAYAKTLTEAERKKIASDTEKAFKKAPFHSGAIEGYGMVSQKALLENTLGQKIETPDNFSYKAGEFAGTMGQFVTGYGAFGGAVTGSKIGMKVLPKLGEAAARGVTKVAPKVATKTAEKVGKGIVDSVAKDIVIGAPLNVNMALNKENLRGTDALKSIGINTAIDLVAGGALEILGGVILKSGKKVASKAEFDNLPEVEKAEVMTELERLAYESNVRKGKITPQNETQAAYGANEFSDRFGLPKPDEITTPIVTRRTLPKVTQPIEPKIKGGAGGTIERKAIFPNRELPRFKTTLSDYDKWRKENFGGAFGKLSEQDDQAMRELFFETVGQDYGKGIGQKEFPKKIFPSELSKGATIDPITPNGNPSWVQQNIDISYQNAERMNLVNYIEKLSANKMTASQVAKQISDDNVNISLADAKDMVRATRAKLGIPSMDEAAEFSKWVDNYNKNGSTPRPTPQPIPNAPNRPVDAQTIKSGINVPKEQVFAKKVDSVGDIDSAKSKMNFKKEKKKFGNMWEHLRTQFVDDLAPIEGVEKKIRGAIPSAEKSLYAQARLFKGIPERANLIIQNELAPIIKAIESKGHSYQDLSLYSEMVHARDVNRAGIESGFTTAEINDVIRKLGSPEMEAARKELVAYSNRRLDTLVESGVLSKGQVDTMRSKWQNYMPLNRVFDDAKVEFQSGLGKSFVNVGDPIQKLKGSNREVIDPIESMIKNTFKTEMAAGRNKVGRQLSSLAKDDVDSLLVRKLAEGEDVGRKNVVNILENGEKIYFEVTPEVYKALKGMGKETSNLLIKALQAPASVLRAGATLTPEFALRNPMRDIVQAFINSESGFNPITDFAAGLASYIKKGDLYKSFLENNGGYGNIISMDRNSHREIVNRMLKETPTGKFVNIVNPQSWLRVLRSISDATESATKIGEFRAALRSGATPQEAAYRARDLMDFARAGSSIRQANKVVAFLNANIQGKSKLIRSIERDPLGVGSRMVATMAVPSIAAYAANNALANDRQKAQIKDAPNWLRDTFWLIAVPGTDIVARLPKPFEGAAVSNVVERFMDYMLENDKTAFDDFIKATASQQAIPVMLTGLTPLIEGMTNYSFFRQSPIIPMREQYLQRKDQQDIYTSEVGKTIAGGIGKVFGEETNFASPRIVDNTIKGMTAGLGGYALDFADMMAGVNRPSKEITQMPLIKAFTVNKNSSGKSMELVYSQADRLTKIKNSSDEALPALESYQLKLLSEAKEELGELSKEIRAIQNDPDMHPDTKRSKLTPLMEQRNNIARKAASKYEKLKENGTTAEFSAYEKTYVPELAELSEAQREKYQTIKTTVSPNEFKKAYFAQKDYPTNIGKALALVNHPKLYEAFEIKENTIAMSKELYRQGLGGRYNDTYLKLKGLSGSEEKKAAIDQANPNLSREKLILLYEAFDVSQGVGKYKRQFNDDYRDNSKLTEEQLAVMRK